MTSQLAAVHEAAESARGAPGWPWLASYPRHVSWSEPIAAAPLYALLDAAVDRHPHAKCTTFLGRSTTYAEIGAAVDAIAAGLQDLGLPRGSRIGLFLPNCPTFIVYYYAVLKAGHVVVNVNPLYTTEELAGQIRDSGLALMVTLDLKVLFDKVEALISDGTLPRAIIAPFCAQLPGTKAALFRLLKGRQLARPLASRVTDRLILEADLARGGEKPDPIAIDPLEDLAILQYTGGTTGTPKGAMLTHANAYVNAIQVARWAPPPTGEEERVLGVLPFFHVFAMTVVMNYAIARAAHILVMPRFVLDDALHLIHTLKPTFMPAVPTLFTAIMNHPRIASYDLSSIRFCISGGAALPFEVKERFEALTGCAIVEGYGLSEASPVVTCNVVEGPSRPGSIGLPFPNTIVSLRDLDDPEREVPLGAKGELCVKGPQVMRGYWQKPQETAAVFTSDGFLRTGDVARMSPDGSLAIEDRIKDLIICSGYNVYPRRIEEAIYTHPAVAEVTVIGIADAYRGEAPKAFVRLKPGEALDADQLMAHLELKLSHIELPAVIEFRDELPKTMIGKLSKKELKAEEARKAAAARSGSAPH
ncbi:MAG: long-chain fatty acid--CoA ligase [Hyphomicrobiaceae bacterium]|nr:long-chain fatty acid--CoA ligase [Hyphomicrobiaceae bacterium]